MPSRPPISLALRRALTPTAASAFALAAVLGSPVLAQQICEDPTASCGAFVTPACLNRVGAGSLAAGAAAAAQFEAECQAQLGRYRECLASVAQLCGDRAAGAPSRIAPTERDALATADMLAVWNEIKDSGDPDALETFAENFAGTSLASIAVKRASELRADQDAETREAAAQAVFDAIAEIDDPDAFDLFAERHAGTQAAEAALRRAAALRAAPSGPEPSAPGVTPEAPALEAPALETQRDPADIAAERARFRAAQTELNRLGYDAGPVDGVWGRRSIDALSAYLRDADLAGDLAGDGSVDARRVSDEIIAALRAAPTPPPPPPSPPAPASPPTVVAPEPETTPPTTPQPRSYRADFAWNMIVQPGNNVLEGSCAVALAPAAPAAGAPVSRFAATHQACEGASVTYDLTVDPAAGNVAGFLKISGWGAVTPRFSIDGPLDETVARRRNARVEIQLSPMN